MEIKEDIEMATKFANPEQYNAKLFHLANTFKLHKEKKLKFFYPENDNRNYSEEEEELLLKARIMSIPNDKALRSDLGSYKVQVMQEGNMKLQVLENHNIYLESELPDTEETRKFWAKTIFFAICGSLSKLMKKSS